jgi:hypothetical protein
MKDKRMRITITCGYKHYSLDLDPEINKPNYIEFLFLNALDYIETEREELSKQLRETLLLIAKLKNNIPPEYWYLFDKKEVTS